jgi:uncharacterized protein YutE (UPF0331/DUF86 family)
MPTPPDDILLNKAAIIERCLRRIRAEHEACPQLDDFTHVDALTLNVERACQAAIDMAMHRVAADRLGLPQSSGEAFLLLERAGLLTAELGRAMRGMVGFRNIAVHQYQDLDPEVLRWVATRGPQDFVAFCAALGVTIRP